MLNLYSTACSHRIFVTASIQNDTAKLWPKGNNAFCISLSKSKFELRHSHRLLAGFLACFRHSRELACPTHAASFQAFVTRESWPFAILSLVCVTQWSSKMHLMTSSSAFLGLLASPQLRPWCLPPGYIARHWQPAT